MVTENITLDGVIDQAKGWFQPTDDADDPEMVAALGEQSADRCVLGRS